MTSAKVTLEIFEDTRLEKNYLYIYTLYRGLTFSHADCTKACVMKFDKYFFAFTYCVLNFILLDANELDINDGHQCTRES